MWSTDWAHELAAEYLSGLGRRWEHVRTVGRLADTLAADGAVGTDVVAAAWLHDLGYADELMMTGFHPVDGARFLASEGAPEEVVGLVAHHTGADLEAMERGFVSALDELPGADPDALDVVTLLDLVAAPDGTVTDPEARIAEILDRYPDTSPVHRAVQGSRYELLGSATRARRRLRLPDNWPAGVLERVREA